MLTDVGPFKLYSRVCTSNLCNDWDGISSRTGEGSDDGSGAAAVVLEAVGVVIAVMIPAMVS
jgi:hypothetical protein